ncbi:hypothetical protein CG723_02420 [Streptomyces sp. CB01635]|nr:hypothetical protein CG723_02420 [Streptomyces sp. CB01635]
MHAPRSDSETGTVGFARWVPVTGADDDYAGEMVLVGGPDAGRVGRWSSSDSSCLHHEYASFSTYLDAVADALESGTGPLACRNRVVPGVALGSLVWQDPQAVSAVEAEWVPVHRSR